MNFKGWLRGLHHQVGDLQEYLNEYTYRFNRSFDLSLCIILKKPYV
jgi:hypothetical protein